MKITYIHHSAFMIEAESAVLLFDYFEGDLPEIPAEKMLYVFSSHRHGDHFSEMIFDLAKKHEKIKFILSSDIWRKRVPENLRDCTVFLGPDETWEDELLNVETYKSTDEGVAFWCKVDGQDIYHAGDLNHWYWEGEDEQWNKDMTIAYRAEIEKMRGRVADIAFLPLDPRLEQHFYLGIDDYMKAADAKVIFPMHFWEQFDVAARLKALPCSETYRDRIMEIDSKGQTFIV
ncbi:MAG: MBL fold metallo-hydrolase [Lachnospiraceae bacterium]|nr:MBL fold metallo-hydrolase [Lachnospiraceae bacterium]